MMICFRDNLGLVTVEIDMNNTTGISFDGRYAYFTDTNGRDYKVDTANIVMIGREC